MIPGTEIVKIDLYYCKMLRYISHAGIGSFNLKKAKPEIAVQYHHNLLLNG
jgi:hypothetical protein